MAKLFPSRAARRWARFDFGSAGGGVGFGFRTRSGILSVMRYAMNPIMSARSRQKIATGLLKPRVTIPSTSARNVVALKKIKTPDNHFIAGCAGR
jgi:hypothetical protein